MKIKVGFGYDVHQLAGGHTLTLGGIDIPHTTGTVGHSDADVLIHAICDALLGAANMRDIGFHFSDQLAEFKGIDSKILLQRVVTLITDKGYTIGNIDATLAIQAPRIAPFIPQMQQLLAQTMNIDPDDVAIKATTTEKLGFEGRKEGVSAYAVCLIERV